MFKKMSRDFLFVVMLLPRVFEFTIALVLAVWRLVWWKIPRTPVTFRLIQLDVCDDRKKIPEEMKERDGSTGIPGYIIPTCRCNELQKQQSTV